MIARFEEKGVFVRQLQSNGIPYHTQFMNSSAEKMTKEINKILPNPRPRSKKWVSTVVIESDVKEELKTASAEYFVHNLISPVYFLNKLPRIPEDAIVIEIGPHPLFQRVVKEVVKTGEYVSLIKKGSNDTNLDQFLTSIGKLYELGLNPIIEKLYPTVEWPVCRGTQSISSLIEWDHSEQYFTRKYPDHYFRPTSSDMNVEVNMNQAFKTFLNDHCIDGNVLYPATGYLMLAWRRMAAFYGKTWKDIPVIFEDVQFRRPIFLSESESTRIKVKYLDKTGNFALY
jgi:fatty acid synthase